jgi:anaerobic selenocysteine-containing dehydrogenase
VSRLAQKVTSPGTAREDWMIAVELADRLGADLGFESLEDVWDEIERLAPSHAGITRDRLRSVEGLDGVLAGSVDDVATDGAPPTMGQVEEPGINAAAAQGHDHLPGNLQTGEMAAGTGTGGHGPEGSDAMASAFGAESDTAEYSDGTSPAAAGGEAEAIEATTEATTEGAEVGEPSGGGTEGGAGLDRPATLRLRPGAAPGGPPKIDGYSLRLVSGRKLYDNGTFVQHSPSLAPLASGAPLRVNPADLERLGLTSGARVRVTSSRTSLVLVAEADAGVPRSTAVLAFNQPGSGAADLIDATGAVTDVRIETLGADGAAATGSVSAKRGGS